MHIPFGRLKSNRRSFDSLRSLRMTSVGRKEAGGAGLSLEAEVVEFDVTEDGGLDA